MERPPFWLTKAALLSFFFVFIACAASLVVLDRVIGSRDGLSLLISSNSYSWTYGPTAVLVIVLSLWRRIDYYFKLREPWRELLAGPSPADKSILLDYITPFQVLTVTQALRNRHYNVVLSIAGFFLLKLTILVSTTLFVNKETSIPITLYADFQNAFNSTKVWPNYHTNLISPDIYDGGLDASVWTYLSKLNNATTNDIDTDWKLPDDMVTSRFHISSPLHNVTKLAGPVDIFVPKISCENATPSVQPANDTHPQSNITFTSETCSAASAPLYPCLERYSVDIGPRGQCTKPRIYSANPISCPGSTESLYAILVADFEATYENNFTTTATTLSILRAAAVICRIDYEISTNNAVLDRTTGLVSFSDTFSEKGPRTLHNLSSHALAKMLWTNMDVLANVLVIDQKVPTHKVIGSGAGLSLTSAEDTFFQLMYAQLGYPDTVDPFYVSSSLKDAATSLLRGMTLEFAQESLLVSQSLDDRQVEAWVTENRLFMRPVALWVMVNNFILLALICLFLAVTARKTLWISAMTGSIAGNASILADNPHLQATLAGSGELSTKELRKRLSDTRFSARQGPSGELELQADNTGLTSPSQALSIQSQKNSRAWLPTTVRLPVIIATYLVPLAIIGVLELLYHLLRKQNHMVWIGGKDSAALSYVIRIASTLVVFGMAATINSLDFTIATFTPYSNLRSGSASAENSILFHVLSINPFALVFKALRRHQFGPAVSNLATLIAGFLTIVVSGLWIPMNSVLIDQPTMLSVTNWDKNWLANHTDDGGAGVVLSFIRHGGAASPTKIWEDMVIPNITLPANEVLSQNGAAYTYDVLALKPSLNCSLVPQSAIKQYDSNHLVEDGHQSFYHAEFSTNITVEPPGVDARCTTSVVNGTRKFSFDLYIDFKTAHQIWTGQFLDLDYTTTDQGAVDCPSIGIIFGNVTWKAPTETNLTAVICSQRIDHVPVTVNYKDNSTSQRIAAVHAWGEPQSIQNTTSGSPSLRYKLRSFMDESYIMFEDNTGGILYDSFFNHLLLRPGGYKREDLLGPKNAEKLMRAVKQDYTDYVLRVIDRKMRATDQTATPELLSAVAAGGAPFPLSPTAETNGTYSAQITHLVVDRISKLILQILIAIMTALSLIGFILVKVRGTLPRDPCSIGSTMAFLAESQLCDRASGVIPKGAEHMSEKELRGVFDGWVFSLGWWSTSTSVAGEKGSGSGRESLQSVNTTGDGARLAVAAVAQDTKRFGVDVGKAETGLDK